MALVYGGGTSDGRYFTVNLTEVHQPNTVTNRIFATVDAAATPVSCRPDQSPLSPYFVGVGSATYYMVPIMCDAATNPQYGKLMSMYSDASQTYWRWADLSTNRQLGYSTDFSGTLPYDSHNTLCNPQFGASFVMKYIYANWSAGGSNQQVARSGFTITRFPA